MAVFQFTIPFLALLGILVFVHELGHFLVAKKLGVRRTIARVRNIEFYVYPDVVSSKDDLGVDLDVVNLKALRSLAP